MGLFSNWQNKVDIGLRPRNVFEDNEVNLYPFTQRGIEWLEQNVDKFIEPAWSKRDRCFVLSELDCLALMSVVEMLQNAGLKVRFYGRLKGWDGKSPFWLERPAMRRGTTTARFMPQILFDSLTITYLMCSNAPPGEQLMIAEWEGVLKHYVGGSYKGESYGALRRELIEASAIIKELIDRVEDPNQYKHYLDLLKRLSRSIEADARKKRPLIKKILGGSWFNYEKREPTGRVERCRQDVERALAKGSVAEAVS